MFAHDSRSRSWDEPGDDRCRQCGSVVAEGFLICEVCDEFTDEEGLGGESG